MPESNTFQSLSCRMMIANADKIFSLQWLRKYIDSYIGDYFSSNNFVNGYNYHNKYHSARIKDAILFMNYNCHSIEWIRNLITDPYEGENIYESLSEQRERFIQELDSMPFARKMTDIKKSSSEMFLKMLGRARDENEKIRFCELIDSISIITDFLNGEAEKYGVAFDINNYVVIEKKQLDVDTFIYAVNECSEKLANNLLWAGVFAVLKRRFKTFMFGDTDVLSNFTAFARLCNDPDIKSRFNDGIAKCNANQISKVFQKYTDYKTRRVTDWEESNIKDFAMIFDSKFQGNTIQKKPI